MSVALSLKLAAARAIPIFIAATLANYLWELAQAPLYQEMGELRVVLWHCFRAALGDAVLVLLILAFGAVMLRRWDWYRAPGLSGYVVMALAGLFVGIAVEWVGLRLLERWAYTPNMPLIPVLTIGLAPVAQMVLLPPLIFLIVSKWRAVFN